MDFKKQIFIIVVAVVFIFVICFVGLEKEKESYLRIHIRANSNLAIDQNIKYLVKDELLNYLTPYVVGAKNKDDLISELKSINNDLKKCVDDLLTKNEFNYTCNIVINNEFFPTRTYKNLTLDADYYDALIVELGEGEGDNWWCVVYPPLCFIGESNGSNILVYKSKLLEIINRIFS